MLFPTGEKYLLRNKYSVGENDDLNYQGYQEKNKEKTVCIPSECVEHKEQCNPHLI